jgi:hypothetical protein
MKVFKRIALVLVLVLGALAFTLWFMLGGGKPHLDGQVTATPLDPELVELRNRQEVDGDTRILFGDLHVHTTLSVDAFQQSLPLLGGEGIHPPADACDFARYCSQLDFYALTDHAEALVPRTWEMTRDAVRQCNAVSDPEKPDVVAFTGYEWSQVGLTPETHYGHKNVIYRHTEDERLPVRPIAAPGLVSRNFRNLKTLFINITLPFYAYPDQQPYNDVIYHVREVMGLQECPRDVPTRDLPPDCREVAETPRQLFDKLREWNHESTVIPHGTTWGFYTPREYRWDKQLSRAQHDPDLQRLVEIHSGHGNAEEYRPYTPVARGPDGLTCPEPTPGFEPCCWRAGEIVRSRCDDPSSAQCERDVVDARTNYLNAGTAGHQTLPGTELAEWGNCGQCTDCFAPAFLHRPGGSAQYMLARGNFEDPTAPTHATLGFMGSSDNHSGRPGTGYKEYERRKMTEARGAISEAWQRRTFGLPEKTERSVKLTPEDVEAMPPFQTIWVERQASFFMTGGLVAVHAAERSRDAIWEALETRQVYATSGDRILLWFDLVNEEATPRPMGSQVVMSETPTFRVKAAGAFEQKPGCPASVVEALGSERVDHICAGECNNPADTRHEIRRIEVVRIARQMQEDEAIEELIEDPWLTLPCDAGKTVCEVTFGDPTFLESDREVLYYVRAIQEPTLAVNGDALRCDDEGNCNPCYGGYRTDLSDDCLSPIEERAWSSPIYIRRNQL